MAEPEVVLTRDPVTVNYTIMNTGNRDLTDIGVGIIVVDAKTATVRHMITGQASLRMGAGATAEALIDTTGYTAKDYLVVLWANINGVEETLAGTYFRVQGAPTAPSLSSPSMNSDVGTVTPTLTVNNASDPNGDRITYEFEVYADAGLVNLIAGSGIRDEGRNGMTSWTVPVELTENRTYYWRGRAFDGMLYGPWMETASFRVNTVNEPPSAPAVSSPADGSAVDALRPPLVVMNASDPDSASLTYNFDLATDADFTQLIASTTGITEGPATTSWQLAENLSENTWHYWRAQADDWLIEGPWSTTATFFVNTANDAPTAPVLSNPSEGSGVSTATPTLSVHNSIDPDREVLTYEFQVYADAGLENLIVGSGMRDEGGNGVTSWTVPVALIENQTYYWRSRAFDGEAYSPWMSLASFMVNTANDALGAPMLSAPADRSSVDTLTPTLSVINAVDPDSDSLTYDFEVYNGATLLWSATGMPQGAAGTTSVTLDAALTDNSTYRWRSRAFDGDRYGPWMDMATFSIHIPQTAINATVDFDPNTLNKTSNGTWVVVYMEFPAGYRPEDVDLSTVLLEGAVPAVTRPYAVGDYDTDGIPDLMVKFNRSDVIRIVPVGDRVPVHVSGKISSLSFEGVDIIRVIQ